MENKDKNKNKNKNKNIVIIGSSKFLDKIEKLKDLISFNFHNILTYKSLQIVLDRARSPDCLNKLALMGGIAFFNTMFDSAFTDIDSICRNVHKVGDSCNIEANDQKTEDHKILFFQRWHF